jgi:hypothetical protein
MVTIGGDFAQSRAQPRHPPDPPAPAAVDVEAESTLVAPPPPPVLAATGPRESPPPWPVETAGPLGDEHALTKAVSAIDAAMTTPTSSVRQVTRSWLSRKALDRA